MRGIGDERGTAAVEFIMVGSILILLLFSMIDLALLLNGKLILTQAARAGARQAIIDGGASSRAFETVDDQLELGGIEPGDATVTIKPKHASYGTTIRVQVSYAYPLRSPLARAIGQTALPLRVTMVGRSERLQRE